MVCLDHLEVPLSLVCTWVTLSWVEWLLWDPTIRKWQRLKLKPKSASSSTPNAFVTRKLGPRWLKSLNSRANSWFIGKIPRPLLGRCTFPWWFAGAHYGWAWKIFLRILNSSFFGYGKQDPSKVSELRNDLIKQSPLNQRWKLKVNSNGNICCAHPVRNLKYTVARYLEVSYGEQKSISTWIQFLNY